MLASLVQWLALVVGRKLQRFAAEYWGSPGICSCTLPNAYHRVRGLCVCVTVFLLFTAIHCLLRIDLHVWKVDAVTHEAYHRERWSPLCCSGHSNILMLPLCSCWCHCAAPQPKPRQKSYKAPGRNFCFCAVLTQVCNLAISVPV